MGKRKTSHKQALDGVPMGDQDPETQAQVTNEALEISRANSRENDNAL